MMRNKLLPLIFVIPFVISLITACATTSKTVGVYHNVKKGETLWRIARAYDSDPDEIARANNLPDTTIEAGSVLFIPNATEPVEIKPAETSVEPGTPAMRQRHTVREETLSPSQGDTAPATAPVPEKSTTAVTPKKTVPAPGKTTAVSPPKPAKTRFIWPLDGTVSSKFGTYKGMQHNGIKIDAPEGTPVRSAASGTVIYAAPMKYFGETVIIKHSDIYSTVYSHLKERMVRPGTTVKQGDKIGLLGKGEDGEPRLYFEIRRHNRARDPLRYLPQKK